MSSCPPQSGGIGGESGKSRSKKVGRTANNKGTLFVGDTSSNCTNEDLRELFSLYGVVSDIRIMKARRDSSSSLGYGFVTMETEQSAIAAKEGLHGYELLGRKMRVNFAEYGRAGQHDGSHTIQSLHVKFQAQEVGVRTDEVKIRDIFTVYGEIADVSIKKSFVDKETQLHNGYGFVHFRSFHLRSLEAVVESISVLSSLVVDRVVYTVEASNNMKNVVNPGSGGASSASSSNNSVNNSPNAGDRKSITSASSPSTSGPPGGSSLDRMPAKSLSAATVGGQFGGSMVNLTTQQQPYRMNFHGGYQRVSGGVTQSPIEGVHQQPRAEAQIAEGPGRIRAASVGSGWPSVPRNGLSDISASPIEMPGRLPTNTLNSDTSNRYPQLAQYQPHFHEHLQRSVNRHNNVSGVNRAGFAVGGTEFSNQGVGSNGIMFNIGEFAAQSINRNGGHSLADTSVSLSSTASTDTHQANGGVPSGVLMPQRPPNNVGNRSLDSADQSAATTGTGNSGGKQPSDMISAWKKVSASEESDVQKAKPMGVSGGDWFIDANGDSQYKLWAGNTSGDALHEGGQSNDKDNGSSPNQRSLAVQTGASSNNSSSYSSSTVETGAMLSPGSIAGDPNSSTMRSFPFRIGSSSSNNSSTYTAESAGLHGNDPNSSTMRSLPIRTGSSSSNSSTYSAYSTIESGGLNRNGSFQGGDISVAPKQLEVDLLRQQQEKFLAMQLQMERDQLEERIQLQQLQLQQYGASIVAEPQRGNIPGAGADASGFSSETTTPANSIPPSPYEQQAALPYTSYVGGNFMHSAGTGKPTNYGGAMWDGNNGNGSGNRIASYPPGLFTSPIQLDSNSGQSHQNSYHKLNELQQQQQLQMLQEQQHHNFPPHQHQIRLRGNRRIRELEQNPAPASAAPSLPPPPQEQWPRNADPEHHRRGNA